MMDGFDLLKRKIEKFLILFRSRSRDRRRERSFSRSRYDRKHLSLDL
jgi:hypothetical protein